MTNKRIPPLTDQEKQVTPMPGEVDLKDARRMAIHFAAVTKLRLDAANRTLEPGTVPKADSKKK